MAIYVGENKALMLKSDRSIAKLFKGGNVLFDYDAVAEGEIVTIDNVHSVEHKLDINVKSKNLFDINKVQFVDYMINPEDGTNGVQMGNCNSGYIPVCEDTTYVRNKKADNDGNAFFSSLTFYDKDKNYISGKWWSETTFKSPTNAKYIILSTSRNRDKTIMNEFLQDFQLELGTTATDYAPYMTDFSNVNVTRCGKNIFDADAILLSLINPDFPGWHWKKQADGSFYLGNLGTLAGCNWFENTKGYNGQFSFSITTKANNGTGEHNTLQITFVYADGSKEYLAMRNMLDYTTYTFVTNANKTLSYIYQTYNGNAKTYIKDIMIAYGTDTVYEPYNPQTVIANADGTVEGLISISPNITLLTDTDGVIINCKYVGGDFVDN